MNAKKTGAFIAGLRRKQNLTHQELGEKLFVYNRMMAYVESHAFDGTGMDSLKE